MIAKFTKLSDAGVEIEKWASYFHAGTDWLMAWQLLTDASKTSTSSFLFYVQPHIVHFCLELFTKALISHSDPTFEPKTNFHRTIDNIEKYRTVSPIFSEILSDVTLVGLIREYQKTVDTRLGETIVSIEDGDTTRMIELVYKMREEMCRSTGLH